MRDLQQLQQALQHYLLSEQEDIYPEIVSTEKMSVSTRLNVYRDAYYLRLLDVLREDFSALATWMEEENFQQLIYQYIHAHPSSFRSIRWVGKELVSYMRNQVIYALRPEYIEMAQFEWLLTIAFDSADSPLLSIEDIAIVAYEDWPNMQFTFHPSLQQLTLYWNTVSQFENLKESHAPIKIQREKMPVQWIIWRKKYAVQYRALTSEEYYMITAIIDGKNFGEICEGLCEWQDESQVAFHAATLLKRFILDELITQLKFE